VVDTSPAGAEAFVERNLKRLHQKLGQKIGDPDTDLPFPVGREGVNAAVDAVKKTIASPFEIVGPVRSKRGPSGGYDFYDIYSRDSGFTVRVRPDGTFDTLIPGPSSRTFSHDWGF
jgi:hypothetical protein